MDRQKERWWDWPAAAFLILALFCAAARLQTTNWTEYLGRIQILVMGAAGLGLALGYSSFKGWFSFLYGAIITVILPVWSLAGLIRTDAWLERVASLGGRLGTALTQLVMGQAVLDPILFLTTMVLLFWITGLAAGYQLVRKGSPWGALIAPGIVTLVVEYSFDMYRTQVSDQGVLFGVMFVLFLVLLIARLYFLGSRKTWLARGHMVENEVGFDFGRGAAVIGMFLVAFAWYSPQLIKSFTPGTTEQRTISEDIKRFRDRFEKAVSSLRSPAPMVVESLGDSLILGSGTKLGTDVVMYVSPSGGRLNQGRFYWTGRVYDSYIDDAWQSTQAQTAPMGPDTIPLRYSWKGRVEVSVEFLTRIFYLKTLFYPNAPMTISRPTEGIMGPPTLGEVDINAVVIDPPLRGGESYRVFAGVSVPSIQMLQAAPTRAHPSWVRSRYLQIPDDFSDQVRGLALQVAQGKQSQYDKVVAVTNYLRDNIEYENVLSAAPPEADPLEWFLFVHKKGFCNYYASAEVMMLRSIGIPARLVVGYAEGEWSDNEKRFIVLARDFHAWPEVYFNDLGWVPFEPTSSQPVLIYPQDERRDTTGGLGQAEIATPFVPPTGGADRAEQLGNQNAGVSFTRLMVLYGFPAGILFVLLLSGFGVYKVLEKPIKSKTPLAVYTEQSLMARGWRVPNWLRRWAVLARRTPMEKLFARVGEQLRFWEAPPQTALTPAEQVTALAGLVPEVADPAAVLLEEYQRAVYSPFEADYDRARQAAGQLRIGGYKAWFTRFRKVKGGGWLKVFIPHR